MIWYEKVLPKVPMAAVELVITGGEVIAVPVPAPERKIVSRSRKPLSVAIDKLPLAEPVVCGANVTEKLMLCCGAKVIGRLGPLKLNPVPETDACEIVICRLLVLVNEVERVLLLPAWTLPKLRELRAEAANLCCPEAPLVHKTTLRRNRYHQTRLPRKRQRRISPTLAPCSNSTRWGIVEPLPTRCRSPRIPAVSHCVVQRCHCFPSRGKSIDHGRLKEAVRKFRGVSVRQNMQRCLRSPSDVCTFSEKSHGPKSSSD
jgi:hypothetical protein